MNVRRIQGAVAPADFDLEHLTARQFAKIIETPDATTAGQQAAAARIGAGRGDGG
jgi:hypothetical protein